MAAALCVSALPHENQCSFESEVLETNCLNSFALKEELETVIQELKSARTIISLLKEDRNSTCDFPASDNPLQGQPTAIIQSARDLNWNTVSYRANKNKASTPNNIRKTELPLASTNRFSPLDNLKVLQKINEPAPMNNSDIPLKNCTRKNFLVTNKNSHDYKWKSGE